MSVVNYVETGTVLAGRRHGDRGDAIRDLAAFLDEAGIVLAPIDGTQAKVALEACEVAAIQKHAVIKHGSRTWCRNTKRPLR